jgi:hypothetical protein
MGTVSVYLSALRGVGRESCSDAICIRQAGTQRRLILIIFDAQRATQCLYWYWQKPACAWPVLKPNAIKPTVRDADKVAMKIRIMRPRLSESVRQENARCKVSVPRPAAPTLRYGVTVTSLALPRGSHRRSPEEA